MSDKYEQVDPAIREEFERLGDVTDTHSWFCGCLDCQRFIELGAQIRSLTGEEQKAGVLG